MPAPQPVNGAVALLEGPLPQRVPGAGLTPEPAEVAAAPSLLADEEDVVTWAIRIAREAAAASERGVR